MKAVVRGAAGERDAPQGSYDMGVDKKDALMLALGMGESPKRSKFLSRYRTFLFVTLKPPWDTPDWHRQMSHREISDMLQLRSTLTFLRPFVS